MGDRIDSYVDEAGDPILFGRRRGSGVIVGKEGCSKFFIIGKLEVDDPATLSKKLTELRNELLADPYFAGVGSFKPDRRKPARGFHANDDLPEVRYRVFRLLRDLGTDLRFHAVVADKTVIADEEIKRRKTNPIARYRSNALYDALIRKLYAQFHRIADEYYVCIARRGQSDRSKALRRAIEHAESDFKQSFGFQRGVWHVSVSDPTAATPLQAADYFLWALQRLYERRESRFLDMMWPQVGEIRDLHLGDAAGVFFRRDNRLAVEKVFPRRYGRRRKKPRI